MNYLIIGSGGREHAIAWRLEHDGSASQVFVAPGNGGIDPSRRISVAVDDFAGIERICREKNIDTVIVGPEVPLVLGIVDYLQDKKIRVFGPTRRAAMIEGSKLFAKEIMKKYGVPTAEHHSFTGRAELLRYLETVTNYPLVIKLDGLAAGKGVALPESRDEAIEFINENVPDAAKVFVEEYIDGEEASVLGISDGTTVVPLISAQDHKRAYEGDRGPNTGGMGAYAPAPVMPRERLDEVTRTVLQPVIDGLRSEGTPFVGVLYAGLIINSRGMFVLEFNARFGDPETQAVLPLLEGKLGDAIEAAIDGKLEKKHLRFGNRSALSVVMASGGYPGNYTKGEVIHGLDSVDDDILVFHAGTDTVEGTVVTSGGRVLNITATGATLNDAADKVYATIEKIGFNGGFYRRDIGHRALSR